MGIKRFKPITNGLRHAALPDFAEITKGKPEKSLLVTLKSSGGRNSYGRITSRHRGAGHKRMYRLIDFKRSRIDDPSIVLAIEYDPNRTCRIALIEYASDKSKAYILAPLELKVGDTVLSTNDADVEMKPGNAMPLRRIPLGTGIHNIELKAGKGGQMARSAGTSAQLIAREGGVAHLRLPSSEVRKVSSDCRATIGQLSNVENETVSIGKAGRSRWLGRRPQSRGVVMNPVDHPHGGGEGKTPQGNPHPVTPWGKPTKGAKTRKEENIPINLSSEEGQSKMPRSVKKGFYVEESLMRRFEKASSVAQKQPIKTWSRRSTIIPTFVGYTFSVYDGKKHVPVFVTENMVGLKLGDFVPTRTFKAHGGVKAKKAMQKK